MNRNIFILKKSNFLSAGSKAPILLPLKLPAKTVSFSQLAKYLGWLSILEPIPRRGPPGAVWPEPQGLKESLWNFTGYLAIWSEWHLGPYHQGLQKQALRLSSWTWGNWQESVWSLTGPQRTGECSSLACPVWKVFPIPVLMSALSPFSPPAPSPTQEQKPGWKDWLCQGEEPGVLRSRDLQTCTVQL